MGQQGEYFQVDLEKEPGTPVYPIIRSRLSLLKGLLAEAAEGTDPRMDSVLNRSSQGWERFLDMCDKLSGTDSTGGFSDFLVLYDQLHNSISVSLDGQDALSSIPQYDSTSVGYRPMGLSERVLYFDPSESKWVPRWVADHRRKGNAVLLSTEDGGDGDEEWVPMLNVM